MHPLPCVQPATGSAATLVPAPETDGLREKHITICFLLFDQFIQPANGFYRSSAT